MLEKYNDILTVNDVCDILNMGRNSIYDLLQSKEIPNKKIKNKYIIPKDNLIEYLKNCH